MSETPEKKEQDIDDFLNLDGEEFFPAQEEAKKPEETETDSVGRPLPSPEEFLGSPEGASDLPQLCGDGYSQDFLGMVERVHSTYRQLPQLDYPALYKELADLSITSAPTPTLQVLNDEIQRVQRSKDRLSEIMVKVLECHNVKKRLVDVLITSWGKFSSEKNAEGRKGDATFRLSAFSVDFAKTESLLKVCTHILKNLDSLHDSLSRRITINQLLLKMNDMGRGSLPDYHFKQSDMAVNEEDLWKDKDVDPSEGIEAKEEDW